MKTKLQIVTNRLQNIGIVESRETNFTHAEFSVHKKKLNNSITISENDINQMYIRKTV